jgi:dTMP kinase
LLLGGSEERWNAEAEALLFAAARADHVDKTIRPALEADRWVISDRFLDSSLAYQGGAGALGIEAVRAVNVFGIGDSLPDRTLVLLLGEQEGRARARERDRHEGDRIGGRSADYHRAVETAFRLIAVEEPERVRLIDASGTADAVTSRLLAAIGDLVP